MNGITAYEVMSESDNKHICRFLVFDKDKEVYYKNICDLVSIAPDMLDALVNLVQNEDLSNISGHGIGLITAALKKMIKDELND